MGRGLGLAWCLLALGCHASGVLEVPSPPFLAQSALLIFERPEEGPDGSAGLAVDLEQTRFPVLSASLEQRITILYYPDTLGQLLLASGPLSFLPSDAPEARPLPASESIWESEPDTDRIRSFKDVELSESLAALRLPAGVEDPECIASGGCFDFLEALGRNACKVPCSPTPPAEPSPPEPPALTGPCPPDFSANQFREGMITVCEPPVRAPSCAAGSRQERADPACVSGTSPCPSGQYSESLPAQRRILYVDPSAAVGGTGTMLAPFSTLGEGLAALQAGDVLALAQGRYSETIDRALPGRNAIVGACTQATVIESPGTTQGTRLSGEVELRDLTLSGASRALRVDGAATRVTLRRVRVEAGSQGGIAVTQTARLLAEHLYLVDARPAASAVTQLIDVQTATVALRGVVVEMGTDGFRTGAREGRVGILARSARVSLDDYVLSGGAVGLDATSSEVNLHNGLVQEAQKIGLRITRPGGQMNVTDLIMRDVGRPESGLDPAGVIFSAGALGSIGRAYFRSVFNRAIYLATGTATISDVVVDHSPGVIGNETSQLGQCQALIQRLHLEQPGKYGIFVRDGCSLIADDVWMDGVRDPDANEGNAMWLSGASLTAHRWQISNGSGKGLAIYPESIVELEDWSVRDFRVGIGMFTIGSTLVLKRTVIDQARGVGLCLSPDGTAEVSDLQVLRTGQNGAENGACPAVDSAGAAVLVSAGPKNATLERFVIGDNVGTGIFAAEPDRFQATDGLIRGNSIGIRATSSLSLPEHLVRVVFRDNDDDID